MTAPGLRERFVAGLAFDLDPFQHRALDAIDAGASVLVAAPTGSGKTLVAEYAVHRALAEGVRAFYTAPIKALSNQKYHDLAAELGADRVGLLTGDTVINGDAAVVVMTTEVLRNMIYADSPALASLRYVVLDEVHYLQDRYRGPVWEEVIIHLPRHVRLVCLSATVSNADEVAEWLTTVRGTTEAIVETRRPTELHNLYLVGDKGAVDLHLLPTFVDGNPNPEASQLDADTLAGRGHGRPRRRFFTPRRVEVIERLEAEELLPAIVFIFSRAGCDDAMRACLSAGLRLTTAEERRRIRAITEAHVEVLSDEDLEILGYGEWQSGLEAGVAAHHAGLVPAFKEAVEECFTAGLVKVVFATETLALGINMPARTVVLEKLSKFTGERHEFLTPADYTQLTGRAGRRGIDPVGHAVVLWSPFVPFEQVAGLASSRAFRLTSSFRPTYNMAANLVARYAPADAHRLLNQSLAQFQADRSVVALERRLQERRSVLAEVHADAECERGDAEEYASLLAALEGARRAARPSRGAVAGALARLHPGTVVDLGEGRDGGPAAVLSLAQRGRNSEVRLRVVTARKRILTLGADDFDEPPPVLGSIDLPEPYLPNTSAFRAAVATQVATFERAAPSVVDDDPDAQAAVDRIERHPVHGCPDRERHLAALGRVARARREVDELKRSVRSRTGTLARGFDRVLRLLEAWDFLDGWALTSKGATLARTYHECDLLVAEALHEGVLDGLDVPELAAVVSCLAYESRGDARVTARFPNREVGERFRMLADIASELRADEELAGLEPTREPDGGFAEVAFAWAAGQSLAEVLDEDVAAGDFVRTSRLVIDLIRQVAEIAPTAATARVAREAVGHLHRGIVAATSLGQPA